MADLDPENRLAASKTVAEALQVDPARSGTLRLAAALRDDPEATRAPDAASKHKPNHTREDSHPTVEIASENTKSPAARSSATLRLASGRSETSR